MAYVFKVDTQKWEVRQVLGGPWPSLDEEGEKCYDNTHFSDRHAAESKLKTEAAANLALSVKDVHRIRDDLDKAERALIEAALIHSAICEK